MRGAAPAGRLRRFDLPLEVGETRGATQRAADLVEADLPRELLEAELTVTRVQRGVARRRIAAGGASRLGCEDRAPARVRADAAETCEASALVVFGCLFKPA